MRYLVQYDMSSRPIGIHNVYGENYYVPEEHPLKRTFGDHSQVTSGRNWDQFIDYKKDSFNQRFMWDDVEDSRTDLEDILDELISEYNSQ